MALKPISSGPAIALRAAVFTLIACSAGLAQEEFRVKRQEVFEFAERPAVRRHGDQTTITFASKGYCDVTVAIEDGDGRIVRHLASGVLGPSAPPPLQKNSLRQTMIWDGKDDQGRYIPATVRVSVRVSLGLRARFERNLFWTPHRRVSREAMLMQATAQGVVVFDGGGFNHIRLFDHDGNYVRTIYPFPAKAIGQVKGLHWHNWPQDGKRLPVKIDFAQTTMLTSGTNTQDAIMWKPDRGIYNSVIGTHYHRSMEGTAGMALGAWGDRLALVHLKVNRLALDGTSGGLEIDGPDVSTTIHLGTIHNFTRGDYPISPRSVAFSPDGKTLYLAGYLYNWAFHHKDGLHGVKRMDYASNAEPALFAGSMKKDDSGTEPGQFKYASWVVCDSAGRVYVGDYMNDRIQVFSPEGRFLKAIPVAKPVQIWIHPKSGDIFVGSWYLENQELMREAQRRKQQRQRPLEIPAKLLHLGPFDAPAVKAQYDLPLDRYLTYNGGNGHEYRLELNFHTDPLTIWAVCWGGPGARGTPISDSIPRIYELTAEGIQLKRAMGKEAEKRLLSLQFQQRSRLYVNPATGRLYVANGGGKSFKTLTELNPDGGRVRSIELPFDAEDLVFGANGLAYLRGYDEIARYEPVNWREVPWDYGEERPSVGFSSSRDGRRARVVSGVSVPGMNWHMGGISVSPRGRMAITWYLNDPLTARTDEANVAAGSGGKSWEPRIYPGRALGHKRGIVHVYNEQGQRIVEDAIPGLGILHGVQIDNNDDLYVLSTAARVFEGQRHFNDMAGTLLKFRPGAGRLLSTDKDVPLKMTEATLPKRLPDLTSSDLGSAWVEGAEWMYGGIGWGGKNRGVGCDCINCQFDMDYFARCFAPETDRYSVAVLDSAGNLIMRIGDYGNADDGAPLDAAAGPPAPVSRGGDEVALYHGAYVATHTDRRVFVNDVANSRIVGIKLDYHATERVAVD